MNNYLDSSNARTPHASSQDRVQGAEKQQNKTFHSYGNTENRKGANV